MKSREGFFLIKSNFPNFDADSTISMMNWISRRLYLTKLVEQEKGELASIDLDVMQTIRDNSILSENIQMKLKLTTGQKLAADKLPLWW